MESFTERRGSGGRRPRRGLDRTYHRPRLVAASSDDGVPELCAPARYYDRQSMDGAEFRSIGHQVIDRLADYFDAIENEPVFPSIDPGTLETMFDEPLPTAPSSSQEVLSALDERLLPYCVHTGHGGYMGLITGSPLPIGVIGDLIASGINQNLGAYSIGPPAIALERRTVGWLCDLVGFEAGAGGNLTSGGMIANLIGLKLARDHASAQTAQESGVAGSMAVYTS